MKINKDQVTDNLIRSFQVFSKQFRINFQFTYFWVLGVILHIGVLRAHYVWQWVLIALFDLILGFAAIFNVIHPIDKAFSTIGLNFDKGYGKPTWLADEKFPLKSNILKIRAAGYTPEDFTPYIHQLESRINQPIKEIRKLVDVPILEVEIRRTSIPKLLKFEDLPIDTLKQGEFFIGQTDDGIEKLELSKMIHMLAAGQTGMGKTQFVKQVFATVITRTRHAHGCIIDMKGAIDYQNFSGLPNVEIAKDYAIADIFLTQLNRLYEARRDYLADKKKVNWRDLNVTELQRDPALKGRPIGPVVVLVDELAELSKEASKGKAGKDMQERLSTLARLSRFAGIHLIVGTQRPSKDVISMQTKDNLQTRICFAVTGVAASNLVVGDMSATTLKNIPGRAVYQFGSTRIIQTPLQDSAKQATMLSECREKLKRKGYDRKIIGSTKPPEKSSEKKEEQDGFKF